MPIITKPSPLEKDATGIFSLDKTALALHPTVVASAHFSSPNVWEKVILKYKSETLGQFESVEFDATLASPEGQFFVSATAEDIFEVEKITIIDKDGAILLIPRADLTVAEFDIDFGAGVPQPVSVMWLANPAYVLEGDGGATASATRPSYGEYSLTFADPSQYVTGDFTLEAVISSTYNLGQNFIGFYDSTSPTITTAFTGASIYFEQAIVASYSIPTSPTYTVKIQRIGLNVKFYVNDVEKYSGTHTDINKAKVPFFTFTDNAKYIVSATITVPAVQSVTWNVAGKTGVGTVTTGANGLITRADAGGEYNVNVLSNETIIGDGFVEFVVSDSFVSVVFGLAEVNSPTGFYNNLLIGCYRTANPSLLEGVETRGNLTVTIGNFLNVGTAQTGDVVKISRVGTTYSIQINNGAAYSTTINNTNPLKASVSPYFNNTSINNVIISS